MSLPSSISLDNLIVPIGSHGANFSVYQDFVVIAGRVPEHLVFLSEEEAKEMTIGLVAHFARVNKQKNEEKAA